jgi:membrane protein DedA with SNARE-associated domain
MPWRKFLFANAVSSSVWAVSYGYAAYWAGREFEQSHRHVAIFLLIIAMIMITVAGIFVHRREAQLIAKAERAMPGPLKN